MPAETRGHQQTARNRAMRAKTTEAEPTQFGTDDERGAAMVERRAAMKKAT
jgi:hypothetical protein